MKRLITYLTVAALALLPLASSAEITRTKAVTLLANNNVSATSYTYGFFRGPDDANADPLGPGVKWPSKVKTAAGVQTTVSAFTASSAPFAALVAGDLLIFPNAPTVLNAGASGVNVQGNTQLQERVITTATDANNVDINVGIDLSQDSTGYVFYWKKAKTGTTASDGWFDVSKYNGFQVCEQVTTINATSLDFSLEGRYTGVPDSEPNTVEAYSFTATGVHCVYVNVPYDQARLGVKVTADGGTQAVWAYVIGERFNGR